MPNDAGHGHGAVAPWWAKVEVEIVILDIRIAVNPSLQIREFGLKVTTDH